MGTGKKTSTSEITVQIKVRMQTSHTNDLTVVRSTCYHSLRADPSLSCPVNYDKIQARQHQKVFLQANLIPSHVQ